MSAGGVPEAGALVHWLVAHALPLWAHTGTDRCLGGYAERIGLDGQPLEEPRRTRVVARQIYVFAVAARHGWLAQADALVAHGLDFLRDRLRLPSGLYATSVHIHGAPHRPEFQLYEHAFVLFALATVAAGRADADGRQALQAEATALLQQMRTHYAHAAGGFEEASPRTLPLLSNPHMHLLEAALAWAEITAGDDQAAWLALADELVTLCLARFIDPATGAISEYFDGDWRPLPDAAGQLVIEPGHQFEWAWLLMRWAAMRYDDAPAIAAASRLLVIGETHGVDAARGVAVDALDQHWRITAATAKLWPQTERCKAWHAAALIADTDAACVQAQARRAAAVRGLSAYLQDTPAGLWHELMAADGRFVLQPCRASSLYHIVCAVDTLLTSQNTSARMRGSRL